MAYLLILLPVKMFCDVKLMDFFLGSANPDCFRLFSPFPRVRDIMAVCFYRLKPQTYIYFKSYKKSLLFYTSEGKVATDIIVYCMQLSYTC